MKNHKLFVGLILIMGLLLITCSKDGDSDSITRKNLAGSWQKEKVETRVKDDPWSDITQDCNLDDIEDYASNGNWTLYLGSLRCESGLSVRKGNWTLKANDTKIIYTYDDLQGEYEKDIEVISENLLIVTHNAGDLDNTQFRYTFKKLE